MHTPRVTLIASSLFCSSVAAAAVVAIGENVPRAYDEYDVSDRLKEHGWVLPAYTMAPNAKHIKLLRAVIRYVLAPKRHPCVCGASVVLQQSLYSVCVAKG